MSQILFKIFQSIIFKTNGKKTISGIFLMILGIGMQFISQLETLGNQVFWTGISLMGIGGTHKIVKYRKRKNVIS